MSSFLISQSSGIIFENGLSWEQIQEKANRENKHIFVDCYATWCAPCKRMDKEVYPSVRVGEYFSDKFISIKIQMDSTSFDSKEVINWYSTACQFKNQYNITSFPTYLFFSPTGKIVNKYMGFLPENDFLVVAKKSLHPETQYYTLLESYSRGKKDYSVMPKLARVARAFGDSSIATSIANDYIDNYLCKLEDQSLFTIDNINFMSAFFAENTRIFRLIYLNKG